MKQAPEGSGEKNDVTTVFRFLPPPNSQARSGTVSLAIVHRQADKHCSLTRELKVSPIHFVAEGHLLTRLFFLPFFGCLMLAPTKL